MKSQVLSRFWLSAATAALAMLVAVSACYWLLFPAPLPERAPPAAAAAAAAGPGWERLLGHAQRVDPVALVPAADAVPSGTVDPAASAAAPPPLRLWGLVSDAHGGGFALLGLDQAMPQAYATGDVVEDAWVVAAVHERSVALKPTRPGRAALTLHLPDVDTVPGSAVGVSP